MHRFNEKWRLRIRVIGMIMLLVIGVQSCNIAMYCAWQTAFDGNVSRMNRLSLEFWGYGLVAVAAFCSALAILVAAIRQANEKFREEREKQTEQPGTAHE